MSGTEEPVIPEGMPQHASYWYRRWLVAQQGLEEEAVQRIASRDERDLMHADLCDLLEACGMGSFARPQSSHEVMQEAIAKVRSLAAELARQRQDGPDRPSAPSGVSPDAGPGKSALSVSPRSCMWCLWDITQVSGEGAWRLAWWCRSDEAEVADPYHCDGHADGVHVPKAEVAP